MDLSLYRIKKALLTPRTAYKRRKEKDMPPIVRKMYEVHYYRKPVYDFTGATVAYPDILVTADLDESDVVVDIGAYIGDWSQKVWNRYHPTIYAFEPAPAGFKKASERFAGNDKVKVFDYGLGAADEKVSLALAGPGSSIYDGSGAFGSTEVLVRDVAAVFDELGLDEIGLLKINIEGAEFDLLDRLIDTGWLPKVRQLMVQFHEWHPHAYWRRFELRRRFREEHELVWDFPWVWELWRRIGG